MDCWWQGLHVVPGHEPEEATSLSRLLEFVMPQAEQGGLSWGQTFITVLGCHTGMRREWEAGVAPGGGVRTGD
jgi:hypothetical protein